MVKRYTEKEAKRMFGEDFADVNPSIHYTGSIKGMSSKYGWNNKKTIRVGKYYYNIRR